MTKTQTNALPSSSAARLNLGCGRDIRDGYVNVDSAPLPGIDLVYDLNDLPLPFEDAQFAEILCQDVLEHVDYLPLMRELHRVLRPNGRLVVRSPHFTSRGVHVDPTHLRAFSIETFDFFVRRDRYGDRSYYFDFWFSDIPSARITFHRYRWQPWNYIVEPLVNTTRGVQAYYEETALSRLFPAANIEVELVR
jgi:SAM-dependent methyltransferase